MTFRTLVSIVAVAGFAAQANAGFEFTPTSPELVEFFEGGANFENQIAADLGVEVVYKFNTGDDGTSAGGAEEDGAFNAFYETVAPDGDAPAASGRIDWTGNGDPGTFINHTMTFLYLKDGNLGSYLFALQHEDDSWWDGKQTISWSDFWDNQGNFSHVTILSNGIPIPEPASYALWGTALCVGFLALRRRRSSSQMTA